MKWKVSVLLLCASLLWSAPVLAEAPDSGDESERNAVEGLVVEEQDDGTHIRIQGTEEATFSVFKLDEPPRLFVDLSNTELADGEMSREVYNGVISEVGLVEFEDNFQEAARLVVGLQEAAHYDVGTDGDEVVVFVDGEHRTEPGQEAVAEGELEDAHQQLEQTQRDYRDQQQDYDSAVSELEQTRNELESAQRELDRLQAERDEASGQERQQLEDRIAERNDELETVRSQLQDREQHVEQMSQQLADAQRQLDEREERVQEMEASIERLEEQRQQERQRYEEARQRAQQAEESAQQARTEMDQLEGRLGEMDSEVEEAEARIEDQRSALEDAQQRAERLESELAEARQQQAEGDEDEQQQLQERQQRLEEAQQRARQAQQQLEEARADRQEWEEARREHQRKLAEARSDAEEAEAENERLTEALAERQDALENREAELEEQQQKLADREEALAERDEAIQQRDAEIERLKQEARTADPDAPEMKAVPVDPAEDNAVQAVRLETDEQGRSQIVVDLERPGQFTTEDTHEDGQSVMVLNDVDLPEELEQTLASETDGGAVRFVSSYEDDDGSVRMEADLRSDASEVIRQDGNQVVWEFAPEVADQQRSADAEGVQQHPPVADAGEAVTDGDQITDGAPIAGGDEPERPSEGDAVTSAPPQYPQVVTDPTNVASVPGMGTEPITIDLRNADIDNVLRLISEETGVNIIAGDDVSGAVTMRLEGVPLDEAFLTILQSLQMGYELRGNVIRVAPQETLAEEEQERAEARARAQQVEPLEVFLLPINYASASELTAQVEGLLSPRGSVSVDDRTNTLIIKDLAENLDSIRMLVETLDSQVPQVLIEARIVETNENFDREVGIQWGGDFSMSQGSGNPTGLMFPNTLGVAGGATDGEAPVEGTSENPNYAVNMPATAGTGQGGAMGLTMGSVGGAVNLNMRLSAMEEAGHAKIISAPRIMTLDNREATISQGTSIPISVVSAAGVQTIFVDATLELTVTPHVTPDGNVRMAIEATKNEPDFQNTGAQGDPTIIQNQAETELLVDDGDTTVIGGIYTENTGESLSAVPFLHRIPIIGMLFQTHSETETRSELLIFITPRIVNRAEALGVESTGASLEGISPEVNEEMLQDVD